MLRPTHFSPRISTVHAQRLVTATCISLSPLVVHCAWAQETPPSSPAPNQETPLSQAAKVTVKGFRFQGNTVFSSTELAAVVASYTNREISADELEEARRKLTQFYIDKGYINSGATLPEQKVGDGIVTFSITEGKLSDIRINGNRHFRVGYLRKQIVPDTKAPLNVLSLRNRLQLLRQNPGINHINADVSPGAKPGEAALTVDVGENKTYGAALYFNNHRPPSVGASRLRLSLFDHNLTGNDDSLDFSVGLTRDNLHPANITDPRDLGVSYQSPAFGRETRFVASYSKDDTAVIEEPFRPLDISSKSENFSVGLQQPIIRTLTRNFGLSLNLEHRKSSSFLAGQPFSLSEGDVDGVSQTTALRLGADYLQRDSNQVFASRLLLSYGGNFHGSTKNDEAPNGKFVTLLGQAQYVRVLDEKGKRLVLRLDGQWSDRALLSVEKFVVGGADSVRGYRENQLVRDRGFAAAAEVRLPFTYDRLGRERLIAAPFFDIGGGRNVHRNTDTLRDTISSVGVGLLYSGGERLNAQIYYGYALQKIETGSNDLQDRGIHFALDFHL